MLKAYCRAGHVRLDSQPMIHHVSILSLASQLDSCVEFYRALGFKPVEQPDELEDRGVWLERSDQQVHLLVSDDLPSQHAAHVAFVVDDFDATWVRLEKLGLEPDDRRRYWGSKRALVRDPADNLVEFMEYPPPPTAS